MDKTYKKWLITLGLVILSSLVITGAAYAISFFVKNVAALGNYNYTGQVTIVDEDALNPTTFKVELRANQDTVADRIYTVKLYGLVGTEKTLLASQDVSWTSSQVQNRTQKTIVFNGLNLAPYNNFYTEITH